MNAFAGLRKGTLRSKDLKGYYNDLVKSNWTLNVLDFKELVSATAFPAKRTHETNKLSPSQIEGKENSNLL